MRTQILVPDLILNTLLQIREGLFLVNKDHHFNVVFVNAIWKTITTALSLTSA